MIKIIFALQVLLSASVLRAQSVPEGLFLDSKAPDFRATDQGGHAVHLKELLKDGKVVIIFYRGQWSPFCIRELKRFQDSLQLFTDKKASVLAVSPEKPERIDSTIKKSGATFPILHDEDLKIMQAYHVDFQVPATTLQNYKNAGLDVEANNGSNGAHLPVPAVYIIDREQNIVYRFFEPDYKKRPWVKDVLANL